MFPSERRAMRIARGDSVFMSSKRTPYASFRPRPCEDSVRIVLCETATHQIAPGSIFSIAPRVEGPSKLHCRRVFTQPRPRRNPRNRWPCTPRRLNTATRARPVMLSGTAARPWPQGRYTARAVGPSHGPTAGPLALLNAPGGRPSSRWKDRRIRSALSKPQSWAMR